MKASKKNKVFKYKALAYSQRPESTAPRFVLFHASAGDIKQWADIDRLEPGNPTGAQRPLRQLKVNKVARFLGVSRLNTIPTAIIVALDERHATFKGDKGSSAEGKSGAVTIRMRGRTRPGLIIDGQHRAFGAEKHSPEMQLNVVAFLGGDDTEAAFQFVVINNTATKVSKDHIKALNLNYDKEQLNKRLFSSAGLGLEDSKYDDLQVIDLSPPFKGLIRWPRNEAGFIPANAVESGLAEVRDRAARLGIESLERDVFLTLWCEIKALRPNEWKPLPKSHLLQKVSIYALTVFILDNLIAAQTISDIPLDFTDDRTLHTYTERLVDRIPGEFWTIEWTMTGLDTPSGRSTLINELQAISANVRHGRPWYENLSIIDQSAVVEKRHEVKRVRRKRMAKRK